MIPNPYNKIPGFHFPAARVGGAFFPQFPVMAWPMMEWGLGSALPPSFSRGSAGGAFCDRAGGHGAALTPPHGTGGASYPGLRVFSLPRCGSPQYGRHIELGVKGPRIWFLPAGLRCCKVCTILVRMGPSWCGTFVVLAGFTCVNLFGCNVLCASRRGCVHCATVVGIECGIHATCLVSVDFQSSAFTGEPDSQDRCRCDEDGEGKRSQVR